MTIFIYYPFAQLITPPDAKNKSLNSFEVEPNAAPSSVPGKRDVFMATLARLLRAVLAPAAGISEVNAKVPVDVGRVSVGVPAAAGATIEATPEEAP